MSWEQLGCSGVVEHAALAFLISLQRSHTKCLTPVFSCLWKKAFLCHDLCEVMLWSHAGDKRLS